MNAPSPHIEADRPLPVATHEQAVQGWRDRIAALGDQLGAATADLENAETEAAKAALAGEPMPDTLGPLESKVRTLKKARAMAAEELALAEDALQTARRTEAKEAAALLAPKLVAEAAGLDDCLAELGHRLTVLRRLAVQYNQQASAAGLRRRQADAISPTAVAGAVAASAPELLEIVQAPRPSIDARKPLAAYYTGRFGLGPHEVQK
jgi:hypothetical protein